MARVICVKRPGFLESDVPNKVRELGFKIDYIKTPGLDISSHDIKEKLEGCEEVAHLVPENTVDILQKLFEQKGVF